MKTFNRLFLFLAFAFVSFAQTNALTQTTTSAATLVTDNYITVTSATGINAPALNTIGSQLYVISPGNPRGEAMLVQSTSSTRINVARGRVGARTAIPSGARVLIGQPNWFYDYDPSGGCTTASTYVGPWVNVKNGAQWLCSTVTLSWVPGWGNTLAPAAATVTVASTAGTITPSGPLFSISGTSAITGFVKPVGFMSGGFCVVPTGNFTWTTGDASIGLAGTAVTGRLLCFYWDPSASKWYPSYV